MTQRFGRNKRRAAIDAVAQAQRERDDALNASVAANGIAVEMQRKAWHAHGLMTDIAERIIMVLGDDSAILPIELTRVRRDMGPHATRHPVRLGLDAIPRLGAMDHSAVSMMSIEQTSVVLHRLVTHVENDPREFRTLIRFIAEQSQPDGKFSPRYYMISDMALKGLGFGRDVSYLAEEIARGLVNIEAKP